MSTWSRPIFSIIGAACLIAMLAACGGTGSSKTGGRLCIATDFPTSGTDAGVGQPTENGVTLAVKQHHDLGNGYTLDVIHFNDVSPTLGHNDPTTGAQNVQQMLQNKCIIAMVGPLNTGVAASEMPVAAKGGLAMISPSNTNPGLTLRQYAEANGFNFDTLHPAGTKSNYFRIPANDVVQGKVDADYAYNSLNIRKVYVVDDTTPYGKGLADYFIQEFQQALGGTILGRDEITSQDTAKLPSLASTIAGKHPDAVFYGGVTSGGGGLLKAQLVSHGVTVPMVGGDGIATDSAFIKDAGSSADNTYASVAAPDLSTFTAGAQKQFIQDYKAMFNSDPIPYSANAYDAAMIEITAIQNLIKEGKDVTRETVIEGIQHIQYDGVTGHISFDQNGDNAGNKVFSFYAVKNGQWVFDKAVNA